MSFESGSVTFRMFYLPQQLPADYVERFRARAAPPLDTLGAESIHGWVTGRHQLDRDITTETAHYAGYLRMTLMRAERKVPESLVRAECRMEELARMNAEGRQEIDRRTRSEIRKEVHERLQVHAQPQINGMSIVWIPGSNMLLAEATSEKQLDALEAAWRETMGMGFFPFGPACAAELHAKVYVHALRSTSFSPDCDDDASGNSIGEDFLTWLWFSSESRDGMANLKAGTFGYMLQGPLILSSEGQGAHLIGLKNGSPEISAEAKIALLSGKKLSRARLILARGKESWATTIDADQFVFRGMKLPEGEKLDPVSRFQERMLSIGTFTDAFFELYDRFLRERVDADVWKKTQAEIHQWVTDRQARK